MGVISWYIFVIWFFWGLWISVSILFLGVFGFYSLWWNIPIWWICLILIPMTFPWIYITWKSLNFARTLLLEEMKKSPKDIFFINIGFIGSAIILYKLVVDFIPTIRTLPFVDTIFIGGIIVLLMFKILFSLFISKYKLNQ